MTAHQPWQEVAAAYRAEVDGRIPKEWRLPASITDTILEKSNQVVLDIPRTCGPQTAEELDITENYDAAALAQLLAKETFTSVAVTTAFCKRAAIAQQLSLANLLDYPCVSIPYGRANAKLDAPFRRDVTYFPAYVPEEVEGAPSGFQILGRPGRDEELVVTMKIVEKAIRTG